MNLYIIVQPSVINNGRSYYKIGISDRETSARVKELQTGNPFPLYPRFTYSTSGKEEALCIETEIHRHFEPFRMEGEWFDFADEDMHNFLEDLKTKIGEIEDLNEMTFFQNPFLQVLRSEKYSQDNLLDGWTSQHQIEKILLGMAREDLDSFIEMAEKPMPDDLAAEFGDGILELWDGMVGEIIHQVADENGKELLNA
jgi:hypothetical protein